MEEHKVTPIREQSLATFLNSQYEIKDSDVDITGTLDVADELVFATTLPTVVTEVIACYAARIEYWRWTSALWTIPTPNRFFPSEISLFHHRSLCDQGDGGSDYGLLFRNPEDRYNTWFTRKELNTSLRRCIDEYPDLKPKCTRLIEGADLILGYMHEKCAIERKAE